MPRRVAGAYLCCGNKVLLQQEAEHKKFPGYWRGLGGHVDSNETVKDALVRELHEEIGLDIKKSDAKEVALIREGDYEIHHFKVPRTKEETFYDLAGEGKLQWHDMNTLDGLKMRDDTKKSLRALRGM